MERYPRNRSSVPGTEAVPAGQAAPDRMMMHVVRSSVHVAGVRGQTSQSVGGNLLSILASASHRRIPIRQADESSLYLLRRLNAGHGPKMRYHLCKFGWRDI